MQITEALKQLGANQNLLTQDEKNTLDKNGYLAIPGVLSKEHVEKARRCLDLLAELEGGSAGKETGTARLYNLVDKGEVFRIAFTHPKVLAAVAYVLNGDMKLSSLNSRSALPGQGLQGLHADWGHVVKPGNYQVCNSIWLLDDFTPKNGATRVVPGSHLFGQLPNQVMKDPKEDHPSQEILVAPAGTVVVFNSHTWHGGTLNRTKNIRHAMHAYYSRRDHAPQLNQRQHLSPATVESFSPEIRCLLDIE